MHEDFIQFLGLCGFGLLLWLLIGVVALVTWKLGGNMWEFKKRKEAMVLEL